jgi:hypothetical protein
MLSIDETAVIRQALVSVINDESRPREQLEEQHGQVWDTIEFTADFALEGFLNPMVVVRRRADGVVGSLFFQHSPRYYFKFKEDK